MTIDVYPVGLLADLRILYRTYTGRGLRPDHRTPARRWARLRLRASVRRCGYWARTGNWRAIRNTFNGYHAEPTPFPDGLRRCGSGWTRRRAVRSLYRHGWRQPCEGPYLCPASGETECCPTHSGWDRCCERPDLHVPAN